LDDSYFELIDSSLGIIKTKVEYLSKLKFTPKDLPMEPLHTDIEVTDVQQPIITEKNEFEMNCDPPFEIKYLKANSYYEESKLVGSTLSGDYFKEDFNIKNKFTPIKYEKKESIMFYNLENDLEMKDLYENEENLLFENGIVKENNINDFLFLLNNNNHINRVDFISYKFEKMEKFINDSENSLLSNKF
jgi:hypothetical protein